MEPIMELKVESLPRRHQKSEPVDYDDRLYQLPGFDEMMKEAGLFGRIICNLEPAKIIRARRVSKDMRDFIDKDIYIQQALFLVADKEAPKPDDQPRWNPVLFDDGRSGSRPYLKGNLNTKQPLPPYDVRSRMLLAQKPVKRLRLTLGFCRALAPNDETNFERKFLVSIISNSDGLRYCNLADEVLFWVNGELEGWSLTSFRVRLLVEDGKKDERK